MIKLEVGDLLIDRDYYFGSKDKRNHSNDVGYIYSYDENKKEFLVKWINSNIDSYLDQGRLSVYELIKSK